MGCSKIEHTVVRAWEPKPRRCLAAALCLILVCGFGLFVRRVKAQPASSDGATHTPERSLKMAPDVARVEAPSAVGREVDPGVSIYPASGNAGTKTTINLIIGNCPPDSLKGFDLQPPPNSGLKVKLGKISPNGCLRLGTFSINKKTKPGTLSLTVQNKGNVAANVLFRVTAPSPIPSSSEKGDLTQTQVSPQDIQALQATVAKGLADLKQAVDAQIATSTQLKAQTGDLASQLQDQQGQIKQLLDEKAAPPSAITAEALIPISVSPLVVQPVNGKLPASIILAVSADPPCGGKVADLSKDSISLTGSGLTLGELKIGPCTITSTLTIDPNTPAGGYDVVLLDHNGLPRGHAKFSVLDITAGPIPPGMGPQVDVLWTIMSNKVASDVFGKRVAKRFYCIEVKIGNNSAHALYIAGIGFHNKDVYGSDLRQANSSYASTRAVLQRESTVGTRNVIYHSIEGAGLLMAAFTPFFARTNPHKNWLTATTIVSGALVQAFDIVSPDRVPGQLANLDDESLRDGQVILNNTQVRTTIFVEKKQLTEALLQAQQTLDPKMTNSNACKGKKQNDGGSKSMFDSDRAARKTIANSNKETASGSESPFLIRVALGDLVLVGNPIDFLPRVQIVSNPSPGAIAVNVTPQDQTVLVKSTKQFTATVLGASTTTVTWSVHCTDGGDACGTIDSTTGLYTAPQTVPKVITVTVTATSTADTTKSGSAAVMIVAAAAAPSGSVTVTPNPISVPKGTPQQFTSSLAAVTWSVNCSAGGNACGTIDTSSGVYTAPGTPPTPNTVTVTATSTADKTKSGSATVTIK